MKRKRKRNKWVGQLLGCWHGTVLGARDDAVDSGNFIGSNERRKCRVQHKIGHLWIAVFFVTVWSVWPAAPARADAAQKHLTMDEIIVTEDAATGPMGTAVGVKKIEKGKNINIPDVLKSEPDIDIKRRTLIGDTADSLAIRGFSGNRIMLNIDGRLLNASGVVGGYYIDWGTIPLDNIEKIEIIRGGSSARYGNNALGGVVNVVTKKPTETPTVTLFGTYGGGDGIDAFQNYRLTHTCKIGALGYSLAGSYQKADPFLWNNDFEGRNLAATIDLDMPLAGQLTLGFQYANAQRGFIRSNRLSSDLEGGRRTGVQASLSIGVQCHAAVCGRAPDDLCL